MADWPLLRNSLALEDDAALASYGATITASGSANTKGSYTQIAASLARSCAGVMLQILGNSGAYVLLDLAIGGAGSEVVVVPNLHGSISLSSNGNSSIFIPLYLPAGTRVAARCQAGVGASTVRVKALFMTDTFIGLQQQASRYQDWGANLAASQGTSVVSSGSVDTKGAWVQLIAASAFTTKWIIVAMQATGGARNFAVDIGVGGAGAEQVVLPNLYHANAALGLWYSLPFSIPGGSRVAARAACSTATSTTFIEVLGGA